MHALTFPPSPGYWFKMVAAWMYYRRPCNLPLRWRLPRTKGEREKGSTDHKLGMWNCGQLFAEQNTMPARWTGAQPPKPSSSPIKMLQRKVVCEYVWVRVCVCMLLCLYFSLPPPLSPSHTHVHSDTNAWSNYHQSNCLEKKKKKKVTTKKGKTTRIVVIIAYVHILA